MLKHTQCQQSMVNGKESQLLLPLDVLLEQGKVKNGPQLDNQRHTKRLGNRSCCHALDLKTERIERHKNNCQFFSK